MSKIYKKIDELGGPAAFSRELDLIPHGTIESWRSKGRSKRKCTPWVEAYLCELLDLRGEVISLKNENRILKLKLAKK